MVGAPLDDETTFLEEWAVLVQSEGFNANNGGVRNGECGPAMSGDADGRVSNCRKQYYLLNLKRVLRQYIQGYMDL